MKVVFTGAAIAELQNIGDRIADDNPARAETFVAELVARANSLGEYPMRFPLVPRFEHLGIRRCVHGSYLVFYRIRNEVVSIVHVLHGSQDYRSLLGEEGED